MEDIPVHMIRPHLEGVPQVAFPAGFGVRPMRMEEAGVWTEVQRDAERLQVIADDLFARQFGDDPPGIAQRCFLVTAPDGSAVGTISAWYGGTGYGPDWGRIHWVAIRPAYQKRGLGRAALTAAMNRLAALGHERAWLATSTARLPALKLYLDFGFAPVTNGPEAARAWRLVKAHLDHPALAHVSA